MLRWLSRRPIGQWAIALIVLAMAARIVRYSLDFPLWGDEGFVAVNFLEPKQDRFQPLLYNQIVPYGFMLATDAVTFAFGLSELSLRLLPFLCGIAVLPLFWFFLRRNFGPRIALLAFGFLGGGYYAIRHSCELKPYASDLLISLLITSMAWLAYRQPRSWRRWALLVLTAGPIVWLSYPAIFVLGGAGVFLAWVALKYRTPAAVIGVVLFGAVVCGSFAAMYMTYGKPHAVAADTRKAELEAITEIAMWKNAFPPMDQPWRLPIWFVEIHAGRMMSYPNGGPMGGSALTFLAVVAGVATLWRTNRPLLMLLILPAGFNFLAAAFRKYPYGDTVRVALYLAPAICTLAGVGTFVAIRWGVARLQQQFAFLRYSSAGAPRFTPWASRDAVRGMAMVLALFTVVSIVLDVAQPYKKDANAKSRAIIRDLAKTAAGGQVVAFHALEPSIRYAPYVAAWRGDGAQFVFYLRTLLPGVVEFAPPAEEVARRTTNEPLIVIVFRGDNFPPIEGLLSPYLLSIEALRGKPALRREVIQRRGDRDWQVIEIYEFGAGRDAMVR